MKITIYESRQVELSLPAYFRRKGQNLTNHYLAINEDGGELSTTRYGSNDYAPGLKSYFNNDDWEQCPDTEFFEALAENLDYHIAQQKAIAHKWGLITLKLETNDY